MGKQSGFFDKEYDKANREYWKEEWQNMPEFMQEQAEAFTTIKVWFASEEDMQDFAEIIGQRVTELTKSIWFPKLKSVSAGKCYKERLRVRRPSDEND